MIRIGRTKLKLAKVLLVAIIATAGVNSSYWLKNNTTSYAMEKKYDINYINKRKEQIFCIEREMSEKEKNLESLGNEELLEKFRDSDINDNLVDQIKENLEKKLKIQMMLVKLQKSLLSIKPFVNSKVQDCFSKILEKLDMKIYNFIRFISTNINNYVTLMCFFAYDLGGKATTKSNIDYKFLYDQIKKGLHRMIMLQNELQDVHIQTIQIQKALTDKEIFRVEKTQDLHHAYLNLKDILCKLYDNINDND